MTIAGVESDFSADGLRDLLGDGVADVSADDDVAEDAAGFARTEVDGLCRDFVKLATEEDIGRARGVAQRFRNRRDRAGRVELASATVLDLVHCDQVSGGRGEREEVGAAEIGVFAAGVLDSGWSRVVISALRLG